MSPAPWKSSVRAALLALALPALPACETRSPDEVSAAAVQDSAAVVTVVQRFGERLAYVSLLAPPDQRSERIRTEYGPWVTMLLLSAWLTDPTSAPGRETSSPWPARIDVREVRPEGSRQYRVLGDVVYVTSVDADSADVALREPVTIGLIRGDDGSWRITQWEE